MRIHVFFLDFIYFSIFRQWLGTITYFGGKFVFQFFLFLFWAPSSIQTDGPMKFYKNPLVPISRFLVPVLFSFTVFSLSP